MNSEKNSSAGSESLSDDIRGLIRQVIREYDVVEKEKSEPAYKVELHEERRRREQLEKRLNELVEENQRSRTIAEEADRNTAIRTELQRHGVMKLDLAFKALKDEVRRTADGRLMARAGDDEVSLSEFVKGFVQENPEFLPARLSGGSGAASGVRSNPPAQTLQFDIDKIRPGMDARELDRIRQEVARVAQQSLSGR